ncbi:MAG: dihydroorotase [Gammaproteobacteria bacterium]|nr:dihydroorotase [Gammaproteobacteria bacterium]
MSIAIKLSQGRVLDPASDLDEITDVYIQGGNIAAIGRAPRGFKAQREYRLEGLILTPGFVDLGCHLREPGFEHKATIASEARAAVRAGFTALCCTPDTDPILDNPSVVQHIQQRAMAARGAQVLCLGALTVGLKGEVLTEMHALRAAGCVGVTNLDRTIMDTAVLKHALAYAASAGLTVFLHSEDYWLGRGHLHEGATSTRLGVPGIPSAAEIIGVHRDLTLVADTGVRAHFCRLSCGASLPPIAAARRAGIAVTADTSILNLLYSIDDIDDFDANFHLRPPLRSHGDRRALRAGVNKRAIDAFSAYHEPHDADAKAAPFALTEPGASTLDTFLPALLDLVAQNAFDLKTALIAASLAPNQILGRAGGRIAVGAPADLCAFDQNHSWRVATASLASAGKNNPALGSEVTGRNRLTLVGGTVMYDGWQE